MDNKGLTYIELLAALVISAIVMVYIFNIGYMGMKQGESINNEVSIQQEANYVATKLRTDYLNFGNGQEYKILVSDHQIELNEIVISNKFQYKVTIDQDDYTNEEFTLTNFPPPPVDIEIEFSDGEETFTIRTTLSRGV